jgi:D-sedoheptulose 7-phosphate isomerase
MKSCKEFAFNYMEGVQHALDHLDLNGLDKVIKILSDCRREGNTVWLIGNGGSAALASHMATDLQLAGVRAIALTDVAAVTTYANDFDYSRTFQQQLDALAIQGDVLIALSGSGNSNNIVIAMDYFNCEKGRRVVGLSMEFGALGNVANTFLPISTTHMGIAQDVEEIALHIICYFLMENK